MKKILLIAIVLTSIISCSNSNEENINNEENNNTKKYLLNPPTWIQGTWYMEGSNKNLGYLFKEHDICTITSVQTDCYGWDKLPENQKSIIVKEEADNNKYMTSFTVDDTTTTLYFRKVTSSKMEWINPANNSVVYTYIKE